MKITYAWLKDHLETNATPEEMADALTRQGLCVDDLSTPAADLSPFKTAEIIAIAPHPDADRLQVCQVNSGEETLQVVCGAANARKGLKGVLARPGSIIPTNNMKMKVTKIRGVESHGMMCSDKELGLSDEAEGIMDLPQETPLGQPIGDVLGLNDPVFDIDVTPNRGDCFGAYGIAREIAAAGLGTLKMASQPAINEIPSQPIELKRVFSKEAEKFCSFFSGRILRGVKNVKSPLWLQRRLTAVGLRPISAVVDITNYLAYDLGRPMHAFDLSHIGDALTITTAQQGDKMEALDEKTYTLSDQDIVIRAKEKIVSLAGIMGGQRSGVSLETTDLFLESALFDPIAIAQTGQQLDLTSDSRQRFERGVDPQVVLLALDRATQMIQDICGGTASQVFTTGTLPGPQNSFAFPLSLMKKLGSIEMPMNDAKRIMQHLGFATNDGAASVLTITPPSWRHDISHGADMVEELLRVKGYDTLPAVPLPPMSSQDHQKDNTVTQKRQRLWRLCRVLASHGFDEAASFSFTNKRDTPYFGAGHPLRNPISEDLSHLRPSLLPNLLKGAHKAQASGVSFGALFEQGNCFDHPSSAQHQSSHLTGLIFGTPARHWQNAAQLKPDFFVMKSVVLSLLESARVNTSNLTWTEPTVDWLHPGKGAAVKLGPKTTLAHVGILHPQTASAYNLKGDVAVFDIPLDAIPLPKKEKRTALKTSLYPPIHRDFAFTIDRHLPSGQLLAVALKAVPTPLQTQGQIFDVYEGKNIPAGKKSVAITLTISHPEKTFEEAEIDEISDKIQTAVLNQTGGELRQ
ncbi:phenylalanine--tRNA ligase subunit beta [Alphaproteobacteria bacterium]|nr:phenylalanine--tRNA ligase subunit beta [Alphaproteobacteria bacterium]